MSTYSSVELTFEQAMERNKTQGQPKGQHFSKGSSKNLKKAIRNHVKTLAGLTALTVAMGFVVAHQAASPTDSTKPTTPVVINQAYLSPPVFTQTNSASQSVLNAAKNKLPELIDVSSVVRAYTSMQTPPALLLNRYPFADNVLKILAVSLGKSPDEINQVLNDQRHVFDRWLLDHHFPPTDQAQFSALAGIISLTGGQDLSERVSIHSGPLKAYGYASFYPLALIYTMQELAVAHDEPAVRSLAQYYLSASNEQRLFFESVLALAKQSESMRNKATTDNIITTYVRADPDAPYSIDEIINRLGEMRVKKERLVESYEANLINVLARFHSLRESYNHQIDFIKTDEVLNAKDKRRSPERNDIIVKTHTLFKAQQTLMETTAKISRPLTQANYELITMRRVQEALIFLYSDQFNGALPDFPADSDQGKVLATLTESVNFMLNKDPRLIGFDENIAQATFDLLTYAVELTYPDPFYVSAMKP